MITVGLVQELYFISSTLKVAVSSSLKTNKLKEAVTIEIKDNFLELYYCNEKIWRESLDPDISMFGIESCDNIAKILFFMDCGIPEWKNLIYLD